MKGGNPPPFLQLFVCCFSLARHFFFRMAGEGRLSFLFPIIYNLFCFHCKLIHQMHFWALLSHGMSSRLAIARQPPHKVQGQPADCSAFPRLSLTHEVKGSWSWEGGRRSLGEGGETCSELPLWLWTRLWPKWISIPSEQFFSLVMEWHTWARCPLY